MHPDELDLPETKLKQSGLAVHGNTAQRYIIDEKSSD